MKDETRLWLEYAEENLQSAQILLQSHLYNPSLQNAQQSVEKNIKAYFIEKGIGLQKTHSIFSLVEKLKQRDLILDIELDEIDFLDSIYLSSKYPMGSVLPDFHPDEKISLYALEIAKKVSLNIMKLL